MKSLNDEFVFEKIKHKKNGHGLFPGQKRLERSFLFQNTVGFRCAHCRAYICSSQTLCGVENRNHCPYCLWSRHVDLNMPGDRLASCKAPMLPIGLCIKQLVKKYGVGQGELMIIHQCSDCRSYSINRIAADDDAENLYRIYLASFRLGAERLMDLQSRDITPLNDSQTDLVKTGLFGR